MHPFTESTMARARHCLEKGRTELAAAMAIWRNDEASVQRRNELMGCADAWFAEAQKAMASAAELEREAEAAA
jgi:hypothetical protein